MTIGNTMLLEIKRQFEEKSGLAGLDHEFKETSGGEAIVIFLSCPTERLFEILNSATRSVVGDLDDSMIATLKPTARDRIVEGPEVRLLLKLLSESQTVNRYSFGAELFSRYTPTVSGAEAQIVSKANHIVFGRRGAGKSMLLLYSMTLRERKKLPSVWLDFQTYSGRIDPDVIADILIDLIAEIEAKFGQNVRLAAIQKLIENCEPKASEFKKLTPKLRREIGKLSIEDELFVYLDDLHLLGRDIQAQVLDIFYSVSRGNKVFLKISAIENLTRTYDPTERVGLELPHDAQAIHLDYNLTTPEKTTEHIEGILDAHAQFAGIASIRRLCGSTDVLSR
ncbi:hypothetical protein, partial [Allopontixanthobacter sp.]|uniref:hypothetical protein n=1 Tax=Allopontixanthobacter sp. TaxID=2906452 RepID=UPI002ABBD63E